jgi:nickel-dependent lactate racemase
LPLPCVGGYAEFMRETWRYGRERLELELRDSKLIASRTAQPIQPLRDPGEAVRAALETPICFPSLRRALTPDDHVTIVVDEHLPHLVELLIPILEHIVEGQVAPSDIALLCPPSHSGQKWLEELPERFQDIHSQVHAPGDRKQLSYLATTKAGRRLYLNRTAVDADQVVVLSGRRYDPRLGYSGAEGSLFPALSDETTLVEMNDRLSMSVPGEVAWPLRKEAAEVAWLLGAPFFVQVIAGEGDDIAHVLGGLADTSGEGQRQLDARWRRTVAAAAQTVVATVSGDQARQNFGDLAAALACATRVVQPGGRIILLSAVTPELGPAGELLRQADTPDEALSLLHKQKPADMAAAFQWAHAARHARIYLLSGLSADATEELFATPLDQASQAARLVEEEGTCLVLNDAHKTLAVTE